ncbi:MAG TPA: FAD-binding oxidoreductase [Solirubrobacteraceae bacterium]|nr:FAD-binding oxidoreductase [Solirubrobacteraceae bacterium]
MEAGAELIARARLICGEQHVLTNPTVLSTYRSDGIRRDGPLPRAAILPGSASEVASVVKACAESQLRYVVRGAGTSRSGAALPNGDAMLIVLTRMRRVIRMAGAELTVEAGVPLASLPPTPYGAWLDPHEVLGTVGGHIAETGDVGNVVALGLVRPDGTHLHLHSGFPGYDIAGAFPGSRGRAGIAVTVTLRAVPLARATPESQAVPQP